MQKKLDNKQIYNSVRASPLFLLFTPEGRSLQYEDKAKRKMSQQRGEVISSRCQGIKMSGSQQIVVLQIWQENEKCWHNYVQCMITLRNKTVAHTILPSFDTANGRLCEKRLLRFRHFATMIIWRHTSPLQTIVKLTEKRNILPKKKTWEYELPRTWCMSK